MDIKNFVGIVYDLKNNSFEGADCIGIVDLFYKCHGWKSDLMKYYPKEIHWNLLDFIKIIKYLKRNFTIINNPAFVEYGDIVLFKRDTTYHLGIADDNLGLLTQSFPSVSFLTTSKVYMFIEWADWLDDGGIIFRRNKKNDGAELKLSKQQIEQILFNHEPKPKREKILMELNFMKANAEDINIVLSELRKFGDERDRCIRQIIDIGVSMEKNNYY